MLRAKAIVWLDVAIVVAIAAMTEWEVWVTGDIAGPRWLMVGLPLLLALPLWWRRRAPLLAAVLVLAGVVTQALVSGNSTEGFELILALGVAAYSVSAYSPRGRALLGLAAFVSAYTVYALEDHNIRSGRTGELWAGAFFAVALLAIWLIGVFVHSGRERKLLQTLALEQERMAADAVAQERSRLARELHDIVSHNLSVVLLQAGGARAQGGHASSSTLEKIERSSREALVEMRRLLGVLRDDEQSASHAPQPGIAQLEALAATVRASGLPVELTLEGAHDDLPPGLELSIYRIVQEALTNTLKHAGATRAHVHVRRNRDAVTVEILDDGAGSTNGQAAVTGQGLVGMRERVALFGGELRTATRPEGGFVVQAQLPLWNAT